MRIGHTFARLSLFFLLVMVVCDCMMMTVVAIMTTTTTLLLLLLCCSESCEESAHATTITIGIATGPQKLIRERQAEMMDGEEGGKNSRDQGRADKQAMEGGREEGREGWMDGWMDGSAAQHSTAQHSTAPHRTAPHRTPRASIPLSLTRERQRARGLSVLQTTNDGSRHTIDNTHPPIHE